jgi:hypothetical protein
LENRRNGRVRFSKSTSSSLGYLDGMFQGIYGTWRQNIRRHEITTNHGSYEWMIRAIVGICMSCRRYRNQKLGAVIAGSLYHAMKCVGKVLYRSLPHRLGNIVHSDGLAKTRGNVARIRLCALELRLDRYGACIYHEITECQSCIERRHKFPLMSGRLFPWVPLSLARSLAGIQSHPLLRPLYYGMRKPRTPSCNVQV